MSAKVFLYIINPSLLSSKIMFISIILHQVSTFHALEIKAHEVAGLHRALFPPPTLDKRNLFHPYGTETSRACQSTRMEL